MHATAARQAACNTVFLAEIGAQPGELMGAREANYQIPEARADTAPAVSVRHMHRHHALAVENRAMRHADDQRGCPKCGKMAVVDEIETLDISRQLVVGQGVPEVCGAIGQGCLAVKGKQGRAVGAFEPAGRHQQFRQYIIRQSRKTLSHDRFHSQCCVILVSH